MRAKHIKEIRLVVTKGNLVYFKLKDELCCAPMRRDGSIDAQKTQVLKQEEHKDIMKQLGEEL